MRLTAKQVEDNFIKEINAVGVRNIAYMDMHGGRYQALELRMADGKLRHWKLKSGKEEQFESRLVFI